MEVTEPVNPERRVNLLVKILLYPQVTTFKVVKAIPSLSDYRKNYHSRVLAFGIVVFTESIILHYFLPNISFVNFKYIILPILFYHLLLEIFFNKKIYEMGFDYYSYYSKFLFYIFFIFLAIGLTGFCVMFYNEIGHVKP